MRGVQQQPAITGGAVQQQPAQPPDVLEAYQKNKARYSLYLLYWYKSTHTDAEGAATLQHLLTRDPRSRPSVNQLLKLPYMQERSMLTYADVC